MNTIEAISLVSFAIDFSCLSNPNKKPVLQKVSQSKKQNYYPSREMMFPRVYKKAYFATFPKINPIIVKPEIIEISHPSCH